MAAKVIRGFAACGLVLGFIACSSEDDGSGPSGVAGTGGFVSTGGFTASGGIGGGGAPLTGGVAATGGVISTGGAPPTGGVMGAGGGPSPSGGGFATGGLPATGGVAGSGGTSTGGAPAGNLDALRTSCVNTINEYRASLNQNLKPLVRPAPSIEACSDQGAASDAASGIAHQSAGKCKPAGPQNTCPGYPPNRTTGVEGAMKQCLAQMWAEGEPPEGRAECLRKYFAGDRACFLAHGHYLNMSEAATGFVSCGFFTMANGRIWMNQDFGP